MTRDVVQFYSWILEWRIRWKESGVKVEVREERKEMGEVGRKEE